jgi:hypothetical protein
MASLINLLTNGYFPRELPPPFKTVTFANYAIRAAAGWAPGARTAWTKCVSHNLARAGGLRRPLKIPNPVSFVPLADVIANNWRAIYSHTWKVRLSASRPLLKPSSGRAVVARYLLRELPRLRTLRRRGCRYLIRADIGQFYSSIYTHAVPWALHTKAACKANLRLPRAHRAALFGDELDLALRNMNEGQSVGIPIGPDTSLVIAEILLAAIDDALISQHSNLIRGFRHVDDYELSFVNLSQAEKVLTSLQGLLAEYELFLNPRKTELCELPAPLEDNWSIDIRTFEIRDTSATAQRNDITALFSKALETALKRPSDSVLRYAVGRVSDLNVRPGAWRTFQNCLLTAATADPSTLAAVLGTLYQVGAKGGHVVARFPLAEVFEKLISVHAPRGQGSEVAWALWGALAWNVSLSDEAARLVGEMEDDVVALLSLHAQAEFLFPPASLNTAKWTNLVNQPDVLSGEHWLLAYEADRQGWLPTPVIAGDPIFTAMSAAGVSFYDVSEAAPQFPAGGRGIPGGNLPHYYA